MLSMRVSVGVLISPRIACLFDLSEPLFLVCRLLQTKLGPPMRKTCPAYPLSL